MVGGERGFRISLPQDGNEEGEDLVGSLQNSDKACMNWYAP